MHSKKWIKIFSILPLLTIIIVGGTNFLVDPLWNFSHSNKFNKIQLYFNERQQKTNNVYFNGLAKYDSILLGSSRATYINQNDFNNMHVYNYAMESMYPFEYENYLKFAKEVKGNAFKTIILGIDFYYSRKREIKIFENPSHYIENTKSLFYRYRMLLSLDVFKRSVKNIESNCFKHPKKYYTRDNVKKREKVSEQERMKQYTHHLKRHTKSFLGSHYQKDNEYIHILKRLKEENPNSKFIIFTSPITADLLVSIIKNGDKIEEYAQWLNETIEVFGEIHHFMTINSITTNLRNYPDDDHLYPNIAKLIANKLSDKKNSDIPKGFGILLNKDNIDDYMIHFKQQIEHYKNPLKF